MAELILILCALLAAYVVFPDDPLVRGCFVIRTALMIFSQVLSIIWIHPVSNGLSLVYNDEMFFAEMLRYRDFTWADMTMGFFSGGTAHTFPAFISLIRPFSLDVIFAGKLLNNLLVLILALMTKSMADTMGLSRKWSSILVVFITFSPSLLFFSSKFMRDILVVFASTGFFYAFAHKKRMLMAIFLLVCFFFRRHLALSLGFGACCVQLMRFVPSRYFKIAIPFVFLYLGSLLQVPYIERMSSLERPYILSYLVNLLGIQFIFSDASTMALPKWDVILQRLMAPDTFVIQIALFALFLNTLIRRKQELSSISLLFLAANIPYILMYEITGFSAARQIVLPFLPVVYVQLFAAWQEWKADRRSRESMWDAATNPVNSLVPLPEEKMV